MKRSALSIAVFVATIGGCAAALAQETDRNSYAAADLDRIKKQASDLDRDQVEERMDAIRGSAWRKKAPVVPADATVSIDLIVTGGSSGWDTSVVAWRNAQGEWQWRRADHDWRHPPDPPPATDVFASAFIFADNEVDAAHAAGLDRLLADRERLAETWYSPANTPLKGTTDVNPCRDGASSLMMIRRPGKPDEFVVQSCIPRWRNGELIMLLERPFGAG